MLGRGLICWSASGANELRFRSTRFLPALLGGLLLGAFALAAPEALVPSEARAATPETQYDAVPMLAPDLQTGARFGRVKAAGDINGDGVSDLWTSAQGVDVGAVKAAGRVYAVSGRTRQVLYTIDPPEPQAAARFGVRLSAVGDLNGDGVSELAVGADAQDVGTGCGTPKPNGCHEHQGKVWVFDGKSGKLLYALDNPAPQGSPANESRFGQIIGSAGDVTGDGIPDIIVGAPRNDQPADCGSVKPLPAGCRVDEGQAFIFDGANGALVRTLNFPSEDRYPPGGGTCSSFCGAFGGSVQSPGDVDGDGVPDQLVGAHYAASYTGTGSPCGTPKPNGCNDQQGRLYLFSGRTGQLIRKIENPFPQAKTYFGFQDVTQNAPGDVNGAGHPDIYGNLSQEGQFQGEGFVFDGVTGKLLYPLHVPNAQVGSSFFAMTKTDYNGDGTPDILTGDAAIGTAPVDQNGGLYIFDGRNGTLLKSLTLPDADRQLGVAGNFGPALGLNVAAPGDLNGDGVPDYVGGAPFYDEGATQDAGRIYFFLSHIIPPGTTPPGINPPGIHPPGIHPPGVLPPTTRRPPVLPRANLPGLRLSARRLVRGRRTIFIVRGLLRLPPSIAGSQRSRVCHGSVTVAARRGHKTGASKTVGLRKDCSFSLRILVSTRKLGRKGRYNIRARFHGNANINARSQTTNIH